MTHINVNFEDAVEPQPVPAGRYNLQIAQAELGATGEKSKVPGTPQFKVSIALPDYPNAPNISHYITLPNAEDEPKSAKFKVLLLKRFLVLFNIPFKSGELDVERLAMEMVGASANCEVALGEPDGNGNVYNRLVVPRIQEEQQSSRSQRQGRGR